MCTQRCLEVTDGDYGCLEVNIHVHTKILVVAQRCPEVTECLEVTTHVYTEVIDGDYGWLEVNIHVYT